MIEIHSISLVSEENLLDKRCRIVKIQKPDRLIEDEDPAIKLAKEIGERHGFTLGDEDAVRVLMQATGFPAILESELVSQLNNFFSGEYGVVSDLIQTYADEANGIFSK